MTQENEIKRPTQDLEHEPIKQLDIARKAAKLARRRKPSPLLPKKSNANRLLRT